MVWYNLYSVPVVPKLHSKPMTKHTETTQTITETINSMDYNTGYQYSTTGSGITASGNLSPTTTNNVSINGVNSTWTGVGSKPSFTQTTPGMRSSSRRPTKDQVSRITRSSKEQQRSQASQILQVYSRSNYKWIVPLPNFGRDYWGCFCYC